MKCHLRALGGFRLGAELVPSAMVDRQSETSMRTQRSGDGTLKNLTMRCYVLSGCSASLSTRTPAPEWPSASSVHRSGLLIPRDESIIAKLVLDNPGTEIPEILAELLVLAEVSLSSGRSGVAVVEPVLSLFNHLVGAGGVAVGKRVSDASGRPGRRVDDSTIRRGPSLRCRGPTHMAEYVPWITDRPKK